MVKLLIIMVLAIFVLTLLLLGLCAYCRRRKLSKRKEIHLNEEQFRENIECAKNSINVNGIDKNVYEHFNEEEYHEGIPKKI